MFQKETSSGTTRFGNFRKVGTTRKFDSTFSRPNSDAQGSMYLHDRAIRLREFDDDSAQRAEACRLLRLFGFVVTVALDGATDGFPDSLDR